MVSQAPPGARGRVLLVDDEEHIQDLVVMVLQAEGYEVAVAESGQGALEVFESFRPHLVILDIMLPDLDGLEVCRRLRQQSEVLILMLSCRNQPEEKVVGLDSGADDYLGKPFRVTELAARVRALMRRLRLDSEVPAEAGVIQYEDVVLDPTTRKVARAGQPIQLTRREFDLLAELMHRPGVVHTRDQLLKRLWGYDFEGDDNVVDVHISSLRSRLGDGDRRLIRTVRGVGYTLGA